jgi:hypothetical protein
MATKLSELSTPDLLTLITTAREEHARRIVQAYREHHTLRATAAVCGVSDEQVRIVLHKHGIDTSPAGKRGKP